MHPRRPLLLSAHLGETVSPRPDLVEPHDAPELEDVGDADDLEQPCVAFTRKRRPRAQSMNNNKNSDFRKKKLGGGETAATTAAAADHDEQT